MIFVQVIADSSSVTAPNRICGKSNWIFDMGKMKRLLVAFLIQCCFLNVIAEDQAFESEEIEVKRHFVSMCHLNELVLPVPPRKFPVNVFIRIWPILFLGIDDAAQTFSLTAEIRFFWELPCARWNESENEEWRKVPFFFLRATDNWVPWIINLNSVSVMDFKEMNGDSTVLMIKNDGFAIYAVETILTQSCPIKYAIISKFLSMLGRIV